MPIFDLSHIRQSFPLIEQEARSGRVYLDNAATTQKPEVVIKAVEAFYHSSNANVHRAAHHLSTEATLRYEAARDSVKNFLNAQHREEIVWTSGATEAINLVVQTYGRRFLQEGDEVVLSLLEHHSNIVPWQLLVQEKGIKLRFLEPDDEGRVSIDQIRSVIGDRTKFVSVTQMANATGDILPLKDIIERAHEVSARVLIDGSQGIAHESVDVQALNCDFYVFSGHKIYAPTGIGALYGRYELLEIMPPWKGGGEMIDRVSLHGTTFALPPLRFEAGTPNIAGVIGLGAAIEWLATIDRTSAFEYERHLRRTMVSLCQEVPGFRLIGHNEDTSILSFIVEGSHPQDLGTLLDMQGVALRVGHHCAMPLMESLKLNGTLRASIALYNTTDEVVHFASALKKAVTEF
ncbi:aminotransferase class V-fold PLP-dependent enzyme [Pokkaliibacter sp. CJK22405]|uniref:aminotransferase class V-fold PLP-dependent enzyme n=1 Tax=Pokkaliibacter sp. CJK22405 TaxID=3384615 RepID=UPI0039846218